VSEEQASPPPAGRAKGYANLKPWKKGQSGNPSGRPKDLVRFGEILAKEFYKTVPASIGGKTMNKTQGEILAMQMVKNAITKGSVATKLVLQCLEQYEARLAKLEEVKARKQADGSIEIDWDAEKEQLYRELMAAAGRTTRK
jgi:phage baseplate assembly protein W